MLPHWTLERVSIFWLSLVLYHSNNQLRMLNGCWLSLIELEPKDSLLMPQLESSFEVKMLLTRWQFTDRNSVVATGLLTIHLMAGGIWNWPEYGLLDLGVPCSLYGWQVMYYFEKSLKLPAPPKWACHIVPNVMWVFEFGQTLTGI